MLINIRDGRDVTVGIASSSTTPAETRSPATTALHHPAGSCQACHSLPQLNVQAFAVNIPSFDHQKKTLINQLLPLDIRDLSHSESRIVSIRLCSHAMSLRLKISPQPPYLNLQ